MGDKRELLEIIEEAIRQALDQLAADQTKLAAAGLMSVLDMIDEFWVEDGERSKAMLAWFGEAMEESRRLERAPCPRVLRTTKECCGLLIEDCICQPRFRVDGVEQGPPLRKRPDVPVSMRKKCGCSIATLCGCGRTMYEKET